MARYSYDAWGACTILSDNTNGVATVNPFRYRGYYFDTETNLYYLQSRYYDPQTGRFINADEPKFPITFSLLELNRYSYCLNNPVNDIDVSGYIAAFLAKKIGSVIVNAVIGFAAQLMGDVLMSAIKKEWRFSSFGTYVAAVAKGAWDGLWGGGIAKEICKSMLTNILSQLVTIISKKKPFDWYELLVSVLDGILSYTISKIVKVPRYIRDIKEKARGQSIKGLKKLLKFLNKEIWKNLSFQLTLSGIANFITQFINEFIEYATNWAKELYKSLKKEIGGLAIA